MKKYIIALLALLFPLGASAEVEEWYTYWAIGAAEPEYPGIIDTGMDTLETIPGVDRTKTGYDLFGFYWPHNSHTMMGFVISGSSDRIEDSFGNYIQVNQNLYGFSTMHFFGREIGDGFYVRGDIGLANASVDTNFLGTATSDTGTGFLLGMGYALPVSEQSRILFGFSLANKSIESENYSTTTFTIGGLW